MAERTYDLEERLLEYSAGIVRFTEKMPSTRAANHVGGQLLRSVTSIRTAERNKVRETPSEGYHV
ncbi:MAG: hypothetical protein HN341_16945 [Verrucomicrobia bacterium]|nr:hypothetical protein [Verrucomicrobiota bacterium]